MRRTRAAGAAPLIALLASIVAGAGTAAQPATAPLTLQVSTWARSIRPGEVVLVTAVPSRPVARVDGEAFGRPAGFWQADDSARWHALVGIPLETDAGTYNVDVRAEGAGGAQVTERIALEVQPAQFETRELRVERRFVNPPRSAAARIAREARKLAAIFARSRAGRLWQGPFHAPVPGPANSSFGRQSVFNGEPRGRHQGADFRAATGTPVVAPNAGEVALAANLYFAGNTVVIDHGEGLFSLVAHLSRMAVKAGARVKPGDRLGAAGATGRVTGPHLHWAVRLRGTSVDPLSLMAAAAAMDETAEVPHSRVVR